MDKPKILVHLHCFYRDQIGFYLNKLNQLKGLADFHLMATISESLEDREGATKEILSYFDDADIVIVKNLGYDIGPFADRLHTVDLDAYDYILKLHTKGRGKQLSAWLGNYHVNDDIWVEMLVDALVGSKKKFEVALETIRHDGVGMVAAKKCIIVDRKVRRAHYVRRVNDELEGFGLPALESLRFVAGTMFMVRASLFKPLAAYRLDDFGKPFSGLNDYTLAHVLERLFSAVVISQGYTVTGLATNIHRVRRKLDTYIYNNEILGDNYAEDATLKTKIQQSYRFRFKAEETIASSPYFDAEWYRSHYPEIGNENPARHYLVKGYLEGKNPSEFFNSDLYIENHPDCADLGCNPLLHYECFLRPAGEETGAPNAQRLARIATIRESPLFDADWYIRNNPDVKEKNLDPAEHYLDKGAFDRRDPSPWFCSDEYFALNPDVRSAGMNPLFHYLSEGFLQGHAVSVSEMHEPVFVKEAVTYNRTFTNRPSQHRRTVVMATYTRDGRISDELIYLLKGLLEVVDNIILVGDCPVIPEELDKLDGIVCYATYERHGEYDFGSYKRGMALARQMGLLDEDKVDELILMNDSCYGPVYPFKESFDYMATIPWDCWGYYGNQRSVNTWWIGSFFLVFNRKIIDSKLLDEFFERVKGPVTRGIAVNNFEIILTTILRGQGLICYTYVNPIDELNHRNTRDSLIRFRAPLIKKKSISGEARDNIFGTLEIIKRDNPELYALMDKEQSIVTHKPTMTLEEHHALTPKRLKRIRDKIQRGEKARVVFLVNDAAMFPSRPLFDCMLEDDCFDPYIAVIPDYRYPGRITPLRRKCKQNLLKTIAEDRFIDCEPNRYGVWNDVTASADIVCYPSPYNLSRYLFNPRYALGRDYLSITFNYGFYRSIYDRDIMGLYSYAYHWKVFMECDETMQEYAQYSELKGANAELVGYVKMDRLNQFTPVAHKRPRVLVALHHSVEGGFNETLSLANFVRYYDYFESLPDKYPDIDFIYRPHPALFDALKHAEDWTDKQVKAYISSMKAKPNVIWSDGGDYFQEFADSDACVQDCGSFLVEYLYTGKPCCYMLKSPEDIDEKFAPLGKECLDECYISYTTKDIDDFIQSVVLDGNDTKAESRRQLSERVMVNYPHAAENAMEIIKKAILDNE